MEKVYKWIYLAQFLLFVEVCGGRTILEPHNVTVVEHTRLQINCTYSNTLAKNDNVTSCRWGIHQRNTSKEKFLAIVQPNCSITILNQTYGYEYGCTNETSNSITFPSTGRNLHNTTISCKFTLERENGETESTGKSSLFVIVPVSNVTMTKPDSNTVQTTENISIRLSCNASAAYPGPNITWFNDAKTPVDFSDDVRITKMISEQQFPYDGYLNTLISNLTFNVSKNDNGSRIYCNASNTRTHIITSVRKPLLYVQYPPSTPIFFTATNVSLTNVSVIINNSLMIRCESNGNPLPDYTWTTPKNRTKIGPEFKLEKTQTSDRGRYICIAINVLAAAGVNEHHMTSASIDVTVLFPPDTPKLFYISSNITELIVNSTLKIVKGDNVSVLCNSTGHPHPASVWNGTDSSDSLPLITVDEDTISTCTSSNVMTDSSGKTVNAFESRDLNINVLYPPRKLSIQLRSQEVEILKVTSVIRTMEDEAVTFMCSAESNPPSTFTWSHPGYGHKKDFSNTFSVNNIQRNQSGTYTCNAQNEMFRSFGANENGTNNESIYLDVLYSPTSPEFYYLDQSDKQRINTLPLKVIKGDSISVLCNASGNPLPMTEWMSSAANKEIILLNSLENQTQVACETSNIMNDSFGRVKKGTSIRELLIDVLHPPRKPVIQIQIQSNSIREADNYTGILEGSDFSLYCYSESNPPPTYEWTGPLTSKFTSSSAKLSVHNIRRNQTGPYMCYAQNEMKRSFGNNETAQNNRTIYFDVLYKAAITYFGAAETENDTNMMSVSLNEETRIICKVESNPFSNSTIFFMGLLVNETIRSDTVTYSIISSNCSDAGRYICEGKNEYNSEADAKKELFLYVKCLPQPSADHPPEKNISAALSDSAVFRFHAAPYYDPGITEFRWFKQESGSRVWLRNGTKAYIITSSDIHSVLRIMEVSEADYGFYLLEYNNSIGMNNFTFHLQVRDQTVSEDIHLGNDKNYLSVVLGIVIAVLVIVGIMSGIVIYRKRFMSKRESQTGKLIYQNVPFPGNKVKRKLQPKIPKTTETPFQCLQELDDAPPIYREPTEYYNSPEKIAEIDRIKISELFLYVQGMSEDSFGSEFLKLPTELQKPCTFARKPENLALNRYNGVYPYDTSRVKISSEPDFFINACYIDGYAKQNEYIASLGPTSPATYKFKTFWMMVWNEQSDIVVMLTNLREPSGMKCEQYWPEPGTTEVYGDIQVYCEKEDVFAEYTSRVFSVSNAGEKRCVTQLHYTAWPDKKVPEDVTTLIEFRQRILSIPSTRKGPMIVHCSAGIGRTGTLIALDRLIHEGRSESSINVFKCVNSMRGQRVKMVQTMEQYIYIYKALVNSLYFDSEVIPLESFQEYVDATNNNIYSKQFQQLKESVETLSKAEAEAHAQNERMVDKNRPGADVPGNQYRVYLHLNRNMDDSDYINGVYVNSFKKKDHFIIAQSPLPGTVSDFVCMMYQENCCCIVTMEDLTEPGMSVGHYLPSDGHSIRFGGINISCTILETKPHYTVREIRMNNGGKLKSGEKIAYHFQYKKWMQGNDTPTDVQEFVNFVKIVDEYADQLGEEQSHVLVHCLKANERSAVFSIVAILIEKIQYERQVSVLNTVRHLRTRRRTAITSMEQLRFCYQAVNAYISMLEP